MDLRKYVYYTFVKLENQYDKMNNAELKNILHEYKEKLLNMIK